MGNTWVEEVFYFGHLYHIKDISCAARGMIQPPSSTPAYIPLTTYPSCNMAPTVLITEGLAWFDHVRAS